MRTFTPCDCTNPRRLVKAIFATVDCLKKWVLFSLSFVGSHPAAAAGRIHLPPSDLPATPTQPAAMPQMPDLPVDPDDLFADPVPLEPGPELDLHTFRPSEIGDLIPDWLEECRRRGILRVRIIHGKGSGTLREGVHRLLERLPGIERVVYPADATSGSWGATLVFLSAGGA
jgi:hypothetical protein